MSTNKLSVRRMNTFSQTPSLVLFTEVRKYFLFLIVQERLTHPAHTQAVWCWVNVGNRAHSRVRSRVNAVKPTYVKGPRKTPRGVPASSLLTAVKLGGRSMFLNPRIHPVQGRTYTIRMLGAGVGNWGAQVLTAPAPLFLRQWSLEVVWKWNLCAYLYKLQTISHLTKCHHTYAKRKELEDARQVYAGWSKYPPEGASIRYDGAF